MNPKEKSHFDTLYQKLLTTLTLQGKAQKTIEAYSRAIRRVTAFVDHSPDALTIDELEKYFVELVGTHSWSTVKLDRNGIRFFHEQVLGQPMPWLKMIKAPKTQRLPDVLTTQELARVIARTQQLRFTAFWFGTYSLGLRLSEALSLQVGDIDRQRKRMHVRQGKGNKDRLVILPALLKQHGHHLTAHQRRALRAMIDCRTGALGSQWLVCEDCGQQRQQHRSCGHRACPQCQHHSAADWVDRQTRKLLPAPYFLVTFKVPKALRPLAYANPKPFYALLFKTAIATLRQFAINHKQLGADPGACAILHTHTRTLDYHPHVHLLVPGAVMDQQRNEWRKVHGRYLFNGQNLARVFRGKLLDALSRAALLPQDRLPKQWVVQCKYVGKGAEAIKYLSRYLYRGVVREQDILSYDRPSGTVVVRYRDGKTNATKWRTLTLTEFLWQLMLHVLPSGFCRVREYGVLHGNASARRLMLQWLLRVVLPLIVERPPNVTLCPDCLTPMRHLGIARTMKPN